MIESSSTKPNLVDDRGAIQESNTSIVCDAQGDGCLVGSYRSTIGVPTNQVMLTWRQRHSC